LQSAACKRMIAAISIRSCHTLKEFHACVDLQREIWGEDPLEVEPATMFVVAAHTGGQVLGAFDGELLIGFTLAVAGVRERTPYLHSHMAGLKDGYRDRGIGRRLKLFQREEALDRGIKSIRWTFDPLELRNAHFNLNRLGAVCRKYLPNLYGVTTSPLHRGMRTDRLLAEWDLEDPRVVEAIAKDSSEALTVGEATNAVHIRVPKKVPYDLSQGTFEMAKLQDQLREEFVSWFARGYQATGLASGDNPAYLLTRPDESR
jgi:predicted GNAT superfamily acetyltransferase